MVSMTKLPRAAVLLATYNGIQYLPEQMDSILAQEFCATEVWVSDDQSTDGTWEWLQKAALDDKRLHLLPRADRAGSAAKNFYRLFRDVDSLAYDFIALADQDDVWFKDKLRSSIDALGKYGAACASSDVVAFWPGGKRRRIRKSYPQRRLDFLFESAGQGCTYVITAPCADEFRRFLAAHDDAIEGVDFHDWLLYAWARSHGYIWHIVARPTMLYRQHRENVLGVNNGARALYDRFLRSRSGWYRSQILRIADLIRDAPQFTPECASVIASLKEGSFAGRIAVVLNADQLRRRFKDRVLLRLACAAGVI